MSDFFVTPWTVACQAPLSMGFPRQVYWSGLPFPPPGYLPNPGTKPMSPASHHWATSKAFPSTGGPNLLWFPLPANGTVSHKSCLFRKIRLEVKSLKPNPRCRLLYKSWVLPELFPLLWIKIPYSLSHLFGWYMSTFFCRNWAANTELPTCKEYSCCRLFWC